MVANAAIDNNYSCAPPAGQMGVLKRNLGAAMAGQPLRAVYDGYSSCPLVTGNTFYVALYKWVLALPSCEDNNCILI